MKNRELEKMPPLFRVIERYLEQGILSGKFDPTRRLPSEAELARKFQSSRPTVARAMLEIQNRGLIERRVGSGTYISPGVGPRPVGGAPMEAYGLLVAGLGGNEVIDMISAEISRLSEQRGYVVLRGYIPLPDEDAAGFTLAQAQALARTYVERHVRGVFFAPLELPASRAAFNSRIAESLTDAGIAVVLIDREILDFPARSPYDLVGLDNFAAGYALGMHLADQGRSRIRFFARPKPPSTTDLRMAGARDALLRKGIDVEPDWARFGDPSDKDLVSSSIAEPRPDGIICANDQTAARLMQTLVMIGIRVPDDIAVASFDDVAYASLLSAPLTTYRQPCREIAVAAMRIMADRIAAPGLPARLVSLTGELIPRQSSGA